MAIDAGTAAFLEELNFTGGYPKSTDLAPSIVFAVIYFIALPAVILRFVRPQDRTLALIRPAIFVAVRIGTMVLRAVMSKTSYGESELIAELVLVSIGFLFLISPIITLWSQHVASGVPKAEQPRWVRSVDRLAQLTLLAAVALAIAGSVLINSASTGGTSTDTVQSLREASYIVSLAIVALMLVAIPVSHFRFRLYAPGTLALLVPTLLLFIVAVYRVIQIYATDPSAPVRSLAAFWVLQITCEFLALCCLLAVSLPTLYPGEGKKSADGDNMQLRAPKESA